jgi:hypothetical protein
MKKKIVTFGVMAFAIAILAFEMMAFSTDKHKLSVIEPSEVVPALAKTVSTVNPYKLSCEDNRIENDLLKQAPHGAKRTGKHAFEIKYSGGVSEFIDKPPYDELLDGINLEGLSWEYCGYNEIVKAHLIFRHDKEWYTGSLLFEESGKVINAGSTVIFSPNKRNFIAIEQRDGADGENWTLFDTTGHKCWEGFSTIEVPRKPTDTFTWEAATIENPTLSDDLQISAHMFCWQSKKNGNVTLKKIGDEWEWLPKIEC